APGYAVEAVEGGLYPVARLDAWPYQGSQERLLVRQRTCGVTAASQGHVAGWGKEPALLRQGPRDEGVQAVRQRVQVLRAQGLGKQVCFDVLGILKGGTLAGAPVLPGTRDEGPSVEEVVAHAGQLPVDHVPPDAQAQGLGQGLALLRQAGLQLGQTLGGHLAQVLLLALERVREGAGRAGLSCPSRPGHLRALPGRLLLASAQPLHGSVEPRVELVPLLQDGPVLGVRREGGGAVRLQRLHRVARGAVDPAAEEPLRGPGSHGIKQVSQPCPRQRLLAGPPHQGQATLPGKQGREAGMAATLPLPRCTDSMAARVPIEELREFRHLRGHCREDVVGVQRSGRPLCLRPPRARDRALLWAARPRLLLSLQQVPEPSLPDFILKQSRDRLRIHRHRQVVTGDVGPLCRGRVAVVGQNHQLAHTAPAGHRGDVEARVWDGTYAPKAAQQIQGPFQALQPHGVRHAIKHAIDSLH
ncbi:BARF0, partial [human gammaherpesvirus 4]